MMLRMVLRRVAGLATAYGLALQVLLPAFAGTGAVGMPAVICAGGEIDRSAPPPFAPHNTCALVCAMAGCGGAGVMPRTAAILLPIADDTADPGEQARRLAPGRAVLGPHAPRAPPGVG